MEKGRIVVGVDGSRSSGDALRWAMGEARLRGATVDAVHVWRYPPVTYVPGIVDAPVFAHDDLEAQAGAVLDRAVDAVLAAGDDGAPVVERVVLEGPTAERLCQWSRHAELLVVGHRGRGGFTGLLLGSVAQQCSSHAACPVVVVRPRA